MEFKFPQALTLATLCGLALAGGVNAQQTQNDAPVVGRSTLGVAVTETELVAKGWRVTKLLRADVYNDKKQKIGRVDDFIVSPDGSLSVAIVDVGGFLGLGAHRVAIPVQQFTGIEPKITLPGASKDSLKQLPEFQYAR
ncbi:PRC-barrel domain-containing protein [Methylomagnum sp.]